jgi:hypothetical protein
MVVLLATAMPLDTVGRTPRLAIMSHRAIDSDAPWVPMVPRG